MDHTRERAQPGPAAPPETDGPEPIGAGVAAWIVAWAELILLGYLALIGALFASEHAAPGDEICGLTLSVAAIALVFLRLKSRFDGEAADLHGFLLVDDMANFIAVGIVFAVVGFAGLFVAASVEHGGLHNAGVALFLASVGAIFLSMKNVLDNRYRRH